MYTDNEGWFFGISHNTGMSGLYPGNYVEKTKDSDCWTVHRYVWIRTVYGVVRLALLDVDLMTNKLFARHTSLSKPISQKAPLCVP